MISTGAVNVPFPFPPAHVRLVVLAVTQSRLASPFRLPTATARGFVPAVYGVGSSSNAAEPPVTPTWNRLAHALASGRPSVPTMPLVSATWITSRGRNIASGLDSEVVRPP